jgi:hypothetical protein
MAELPLKSDTINNSVCADHQADPSLAVLTHEKEEMIEAGSYAGK